VLLKRWTNWGKTGFFENFLGLPEKTCSDEDNASSELHPTEVMSRVPIQSPSDTPKLAKQCVTPLHGTANAANPRNPGLPTPGCTHTETAILRPPTARFIPIGSIAVDRRQISRIGAIVHNLRQWRLYHQSIKHICSLLAIIRIGASNDRSQRHATSVSG
jgi:hypothetical protein